jgi:hypothetical protein
VIKNIGFRVLGLLLLVLGVRLAGSIPEYFMEDDVAAYCEDSPFSSACESPNSGQAMFAVCLVGFGAWLLFHRKRTDPQPVHLRS